MTPHGWPPPVAASSTEQRCWHASTQCEAHDCVTTDSADSGTEQSKPFHPCSHAHCPLPLHSPCSEHAKRHACQSHSCPDHPGSHQHVSFAHTPRPLHPPSHSFASHAGPPQPASQRHTAFAPGPSAGRHWPWPPHPFGHVSISEQSSPLKPGAHLHRGRPPRTTHSPLFEHGGSPMHSGRSQLAPRCEPGHRHVPA